MAARGRGIPGQPGQHLVGDPADDGVGQPGQRGGIARGERVVERGLRGYRVGVVAAGRGRGERVRAVGDDEDADRIDRLVDLGAQPATAGQRGVDVVVGGVHPHLCTRVGLGLAADPARDQRTQRQFGERIAGSGRQRDAPVDAVAGERACRVGTQHSVGGADTDGDPPRRQRARGGEDRVRRRSASSPAALAASSGTMTGADGMIAMALSTPPN